MDDLFHQEERHGAANQKRRLHEAGEAENLGNDGEDIECSKRPRTEDDLQSQRPQYGDFVALHVDTHNHFSSPDYQFTQTPVVAKYETLGLYNNADLQPACNYPTSFHSSEDSYLFNGVFSREGLGYMDVEVGTTDPSITDAIDTRESSASGFDQSPSADSMATTEAATANTTPQAEEDGTGCGAEDTANNAICNTCFGMVGARSPIDTPLAEVVGLTITNSLSSTQSSSAMALPKA